MKKIKVIILIVLMVLCVCGVVSAADLTSEEMGYMSLSDYGYYVAILGVACGMAFIMGLR
jgi:hypothetical protein